jgi:hypothetical protein
MTGVTMAPSLLLALLGLVLLFFGRTLYWAFVAVAGFLMGLELAADLLADQPGWVQFLAAIAAGVLGAIVGIFVQRLAFAVGGFFAGGYLTLALFDRLPEAAQSNFWFIVGGVIGAIVAALVMDWAIVVLSSLAGAVAIVSIFNMHIEFHIVAVLALAAFGIIVQGRRLTGSQGAAPAPPVA